MKAFEKLGDNKVTNVSISLNDLERKLETVSVNLSNVVDYEVVKNKKKFNTLKTKVNYLERELLMQLF